MKLPRFYLRPHKGHRCCLSLRRQEQLENRVTPRTEAGTTAGLNMVGDLSSREPTVGEQLAEEDMLGEGNEEHHLVEG